MGPIIWLIAAGILALAEFAVMDFSLLMLAIAALATAGVAVADVPLWAEVLVFAVSSALTFALVRPMLRKRLLSAKSPDDFSTKQLVGRAATVVEPVASADNSGGMVRIAGELWSARAAHNGETFAPGEDVQVLDIEGTTAVVWKGI
ncbi:MAG TPA: NfeD family protein [Candidatus Corynebacterium gallistercoris]|uniref:NfeD family protein n=1 Tax=Candidatus Corynebacterium gallistercoris TaxID=2838530 RepID=A0A9D1RYC3_9CORY|nr:NfeD family protein [Candidatus Corynebacterium gallistercoris]